MNVIAYNNDMYLYFFIMEEIKCMYTCAYILGFLNLNNSQ